MSEVSDRLAAALAGRYTLERELGQGGMATVFLAEITTTAALQHPHILPLHDSGTVDRTVFYVMPFAEGESLRDRIAREKQLPIADVALARTAEEGK